MDLKKTSFQTSRLKVFLFFLILAMVYWGLTKFSKEYTGEVTAQLIYTELPKTALLTQDNPKEISFDMTSTGFQLLYFKLRAPKVQVPVLRHYEQGDSLVTLNEEVLRNYVVKDLNNNESIKNLSLNSISVVLDAIIEKKVPVVARANLNFKNGFQALDSLKLIPNEVRVTGPSHTLDTIKSIETISFEINDIEKNISRSVALQQPKQEKVRLLSNSVAIELEVDEFTQHSFTIPIKLINRPADEKVKIIPTQSLVSFSVSLRQFNTIAAGDFELICDYSKRDTEGNFMIPVLTRSPQGIRNVEIEVNKVDYLLFK